MAAAASGSREAPPAPKDTNDVEMAESLEIPEISLESDDFSHVYPLVDGTSDARMQISEVSFDMWNEREIKNNSSLEVQEKIESSRIYMTL